MKLMNLSCNPFYSISLKEKGKNRQDLFLGDFVNIKACDYLNWKIYLVSYWMLKKFV